jgi:hypothetical protein
VLVEGSSSSGSDVANPPPCRTRSKDTRARPRTCSGQPFCPSVAARGSLAQRRAGYVRAYKVVS